MANKTYGKFSTKATPQSEPIPGQKMVENSAGGFVYALDEWGRLDRFLILGTEGGTYYVRNEDKFTKENVEAIMDLIAKDGNRVLRRIVDISVAGRAPKNEPALFALALVMSVANAEVRSNAFTLMPMVARTGTHLFHLHSYLKNMRGRGRGWRRAFANWYNAQKPEDVAYQMAKYRQRDGVTHKDLVRLAHPKPDSQTHEALYRWVTKGMDSLGDDKVFLPTLIRDFETLQQAKEEKEVLEVIKRNKSIAWEMIPTQFLKSVPVWDALLPNVPPNALLRNLGRLTSIGLLKANNAPTDLVVKRLTDADVLKKGRVHPLAILNALRVYGSGKGSQGSLTWNTLRKIMDALDKAFYVSFGTIEPAGKRTMLALDVSDSMKWNNIAGMAITPREASAAMALITAATEPSYEIVAFSHGEGRGFDWRSISPGDVGIQPLAISPRQRMDDVMSMIAGQYAGGTDCALPMIYALNNGVEIDTFVIYTDNETWAGQKIHPSQALLAYRAKTGIDAKLVVVGMTSTGFSIADPNDAGMMDVVGFDTAAPQFISDFSAGRV